MKSGAYAHSLHLQETSPPIVARLFFMQPTGGDNWRPKMAADDYRWEYSPLATAGARIWAKKIDPVLRFAVGGDDPPSFQHIRAAIQLTVLVALILLPLSLFVSPAHMLTASGLLFDIAGTMRLFLFERIEHELSGFKPNEYDNYPSVAMRELIMPESVSVMEINDRPISFFYYKQRGVVFLFIGFVLQMLGDWV